MSTGPLTVTDQFCGAGGSSQGVRRYGERSGLGNGIVVKAALNHDKLAIATHNTNFPEAEHYCTDIQSCEPKWFPKTDILITSPECTNHSVAKGKKQVKATIDLFNNGKADAAAERSRATMWDVVRFSEQHRYKIVITENVVDANAWVLIDAWLNAMVALGYNFQRVFFNSMFAWPTPQSRDRVYFVFWLKGNKKPDLDIRPLAPCPKCGPVNSIQRFKPGASIKAKYGTQYTYVCPRCAKDVMPFYFAAINAIDWTVPAERIGDRKKPLEPRTMQRIAYGLEKYGNRPLSVTNYFSSGVACRVKDATEAPLFTQHGKSGTAVVLPYIANLRSTDDKNMPYTSSGIHQALNTITAGGPHHGVISPFQVDAKYSHAGPERAKGASDPLRAQTVQDGTAVVLPFVVGTERDGERRAKGAEQPLPAQTARATNGVVLPFVMDGSFTKAGGDYMNAADQPIGTQTTTESKSVVIPPGLMMSLNYPEQVPNPVSDPMHTITGSRPEAVLTPFMTSMRGTSDGHLKGTAHGADEPMGTISAGGNHHALITGSTLAFLASHYSANHVCAGMDEPMGTVATRDRHGLVTGQQAVDIMDLYFRMLKHHEVQRGMAFDPDYVVLGNSRQKVKQLGNAVTPPVMEILIERCVQSLM